MQPHPPPPPLEFKTLFCIPKMLRLGKNRVPDKKLFSTFLKKVVGLEKN